MYTLNLGGEGEVPGAINQQGPWVLTDPRWRSSREGTTFDELLREGHRFLICPNTEIGRSDNSVGTVLTNGVPVDRPSMYGPGVQTSEIKRILKPGGEWYPDEELEWTKPLSPS
jgi:hypothetical protein